MWKEGRVLANLKEERSNMKAAMCQTVARHFYECFPCPYNLGGGQLLPLTGEEIGLAGENKLIRVTQVHSGSIVIPLQLTEVGVVDTWIVLKLGPKRWKNRVHPMAISISLFPLVQRQHIFT